MRACSFFRVLAVGLAVSMVGPAGAVEVTGTSVSLGWLPAEGSVTHYVVWVARNGPFPEAPEAMLGSGQRSYRVHGSPGDVVRVRVAAADVNAFELGPASGASIPLYFEPETSAGEPLLRNGSFEAGLPERVATLPAETGHLVDWEILGHSVDRVGSSVWPAAEGHHSIDLNGLGAGGIRQSFDTRPGQDYAAYFSISLNPADGPYSRILRVSAAGEEQDFAIEAAGVSMSDMRWQHHVFFFTANSGSTSLEFHSLSDPTGAYGPTLDAVEVYALPSP